MADLHNGKLLSVEDAILYVLERYWNPLSLPDEASRHGAYARYVAPVRQALTNQPSLESLVELLWQAKVRDFGVVGFPRTRERRAARKLLQIEVRRNDQQVD